MENKDQSEDQIAGQVFDLNGACLVTMKTTDSKVLIHSEEFQVEVKGDSLVISRVGITSTLAKASTSILLSRSNELQKRKEDIVALDQTIKGLMAQLENDDATSITEQLASLAGVKGKHKKVIRELEDQKEVSIKYEEERFSQFVVIEAGKLVKLKWFPAPILWCPSINIQEEKKIVSKTQNVPVSSLGTTVLTHEADFDKKGPGLIYWLGTKSGTQPFKNPVSSKVIKLATYRARPERGNSINEIFSYSKSGCCLLPSTGSFTLNLGQYSLSPTHYCLGFVQGHVAFQNLSAFRTFQETWKLEGSVNGNSWSLLHQRNPNLAAGAVSWKLNQHPQELQFKFIRLTQIGDCIYGYTGFEIYGTVTENFSA